MSLQAKEALLIKKDKEGQIISERKIEIELVQRGDLIKVLPGENIAVDGVVVEGSSSADESFITGENIPVVKIPGIIIDMVVFGENQFFGKIDFLQFLLKN